MDLLRASDHVWIKIKQVQRIFFQAYSSQVVHVFENVVLLLSMPHASMEKAKSGVRRFKHMYTWVDFHLIWGIWLEKQIKNVSSTSTNVKEDLNLKEKGEREKKAEVSPSVIYYRMIVCTCTHHLISYQFIIQYDLYFIVVSITWYQTNLL